jgi:hypothetical protein
LMWRGFLFMGGTKQHAASDAFRQESIRAAER